MTTPGHAPQPPVGVGDRLPGVEFAHTTLEQMVRWAAAADDYSPIHFDPVAASARNLPGVVVTGPWKSAMLTRMITEWLGARGVLRRVRCEYRRPDLLGGRLRCGGEVTAIRGDGAERVAELALRVEDGSGQITVTGTATVSLVAPTSRAPA